MSRDLGELQQKLTSKENEGQLVFPNPRVSSQCVRAVIPGGQGKKKSWKKGLTGTAARSILDERKEFGCVLAESSEDRLERNCSCPWEVRDEQQPWI